MISITKIIHYHYLGADWLGRKEEWFGEEKVWEKIVHLIGGGDFGWENCFLSSPTFFRGFVLFPNYGENEEKGEFKWKNATMPLFPLHIGLLSPTPFLQAKCWFFKRKKKILNVIFLRNREMGVNLQLSIFILFFFSTK